MIIIIIVIIITLIIVIIIIIIIVTVIVRRWFSFSGAIVKFLRYEQIVKNISVSFLIVSSQFVNTIIIGHTVFVFLFLTVS